MDVIQVARESTGCLSYVLLDAGSRAAVVIDPTLEPDVYEGLARAHNRTIEGVWETHTHADHISSARELACGVGVPLHIPAKAGAASAMEQYDPGSANVPGLGRNPRSGLAGLCLRRMELRKDSAWRASLPRLSARS
jgi:glyoxylase-like metal-dependent hydrolase (beta-lactamase superfamily II)